MRREVKKQTQKRVDFVKFFCSTSLSSRNEVDSLLLVSYGTPAELAGDGPGQRQMIFFDISFKNLLKFVL